MRAASASLALLALALYAPPVPAQPTNPPPARTCPLLLPVTEAAKSNTLYLYFPTQADKGFSYMPPAKPFDAGALNKALAGQTQALIDGIKAVVAEDYCEFNVQVQTTTTNPDYNPKRPANRATVAIGSDTYVLYRQRQPHTQPYWGMAPDGAINPGHARVWAGYYSICEGGSYINGALSQTCPATAELSGQKASVDRWAQAIGGTAAHEGGHTYGLAHSDEDPVNAPDEPATSSPPADEDPYNRLLMPAGEYVAASDRVNYRRHFGDRTYGLLATQVGLVMETMHNWDLQNLDQVDAYSLSMDFLYPQPTPPTIDWTYLGSESPWINPQVSVNKNYGANSSLVNGHQYYPYTITWSTPNPAFAGKPGVVPGGGRFHVGTTFTGVDFNQPDAIRIGAVTLYDAAGKALPLHPRLPGFDAGTVDAAASSSFRLNIYMPMLQERTRLPLRLKSARVYQLPRVASIESMVGEGSPRTFDGAPIKPWSVTSCRPGSLAGGLHCRLADRDDPPHVQVEHRLGDPGVIDCSKPIVTLPTFRGPPPEGSPPPAANPPAPQYPYEPRGGPKDSPFAPDREGAVCAGIRRDPFPSTTVYVIATFVDPKARHYDAKRKRYVVGPVTSRVFYQFAGVRDPDKLWHNVPTSGHHHRDKECDRDDDRDRDEDRDEKRHRRHRRHRDRDHDGDRDR